MQPRTKIKHFLSDGHKIYTIQCLAVKCSNMSGLTVVFNSGVLPEDGILKFPGGGRYGGQGMGGFALLGH